MSFMYMTNKMLMQLNMQVTQDFMLRHDTAMNNSITSLGEVKALLTGLPFNYTDLADDFNSLMTKIAHKKYQEQLAKQKIDDFNKFSKDKLKK